MSSTPKRLTRRLPPVLIGTLLVMWLWVNQTLAPAQIVLGALLATGLAWASSRLRPLQPRLVRWRLAAVLVRRLVVDVVRSNVRVARIVLGRGRPRSGFVDVPLDLRDPHGLAVLAMVVTATPGSVWVDLSSDGRCLTLHVLDLGEEGQWIDWIKGRYERLLMEIFE